MKKSDRNQKNIVNIYHKYSCKLTVSTFDQDGVRKTTNCLLSLYAALHCKLKAESKGLIAYMYRDGAVLMMNASTESCKRAQDAFMIDFEYALEEE